LQKIEYDYNNLGLVAQSQVNVLSPDPTLIDNKKTPKYTLDGQVLVNDTTNPFVKNGYDNQSRAIFREEADSGGFNIHFILGYVYDSLSRAVQIQYLPWGATSKNHGTPFNVEYINFDAANRVVLINSGFSCIVNTCTPIYEFDGKEIRQFFYKDNSSSQLDSLVREFREKARNDKLVSRIVNKFSYRQDGLKQEDCWVAIGLDDSGTCWGTQFYQEQKTAYYYDSLGYNIRSDFWERRSVDSDFTLHSTSLCYRRVYDAWGNTIQQFDFCDTNESLSWEARYNEFNHIIQLEGDGMLNGQKVPYISTFQWDLLDLEKQKGFLHE
jgi:hypothetical protein